MTDHDTQTWEVVSYCPKHKIEKEIEMEKEAKYFVISDDDAPACIKFDLNSAKEYAEENGYDYIDSFDADGNCVGSIKNTLTQIKAWTNNF